MTRVRESRRFSAMLLAVGMMIALIPLSASPVRAAGVGDIVINEIMQNPASVGDSAGEWFEVVNTTSSAIDINGWTVADDDIDSFVIDNGAPLNVPANGYLVLGVDDDPSSNGGVTVDYEYSGMFLSNGADELVLIDGTTEIDRVEWDGGPTFPDPEGASMALRSPSNDNNVGANWCESATVFGAGDSGTPGAANDCSDAPPPPPDVCQTPDDELTTISEIQGTGFESPLDGQTVVVRAVVTLADDDLDGYFIQEEPADQDDDPASSEGLFVFDRRTLPIEGQTVELTDEVTSFRGLTQLSFPAMEICDVPTVSIAPTPIMLPLDDAGRESLEGMLVTNGQDLQVTGLFTAYRFGELGLALGGPLPQATSVFSPGVPAAAELEADNLARELKVNDRDEAFGQFNPYPWELFDEGLSAGDTMPAGRLVGALGFSFGEYKVEPLDNEVGDPSDRIFFPETDDTVPVPTAPRLDRGNDIATFNVLNYFNTFGDSDVLRGAENQEDFEVQTAKLVDAIQRLDASIVGLVELENDYEDFYDGDPATVPSIVALVEALNRDAGFDRWSYIVPPEAILTSEGLGDGGLGTDAIAVGIIYQGARTSPVLPATTFDIDAQLSGDADNNRWPLAQAFDIDGNRVTVVVNHFKSKGSPCTDTAGPDFALGDDVGTALTGNCDLTRRYAAERLVDWVETKGNPVFANRKVFLVGDFNSYEEEAPIEILIDAGYVDTVQALGGDAFTFKFSGRYGRLDYIFASSKIARKTSEAAVWQINSIAPTGYLYFNDPIDQSAHGSSDHDPVVVSLKE